MTLSALTPQFFRGQRKERRGCCFSLQVHESLSSEDTEVETTCFSETLWWLDLLTLLPLAAGKLMASGSSSRWLHSDPTASWRQWSLTQACPPCVPDGGHPLTSQAHSRESQKGTRLSTGLLVTGGSEAGAARECHPPVPRFLTAETISGFPGPWRKGPGVMSAGYPEGPPRAGPSSLLTLFP